MKELVDHEIILITEEGATRGTLDAEMNRAELDRWALDCALNSLDPAEFMQLIIDYYGRDFILDLLEGQPSEPSPTYAFPVGEDEYPPEVWYCAQYHGPHHTGLDLNLDKSPYGDVERTLGLSVFAVADGVVRYVTDDWSGAGMVVVEHEIDGTTYWLRYAHIVPIVREGVHVKAGDKLGGFADWKTGDHLHFDGATEPIEREWLDDRIAWIDPEVLLKSILDPDRVEAMLKKGS